jgi:hypothetical protein
MTKPGRPNQTTAGDQPTAETAGQVMRCAVCGLRMDRVLPFNGYRTHPLCWPGEVSPRWEPGDTPLSQAAPRTGRSC